MTLSLLATLFVVVSPPLLMYNYLVYPELIAAVLVTAVLYSRFSSPMKVRLNCTMPALTKRSVGSSAGTRDELLTCLWLCFLK